MILSEDCVSSPFELSCRLFQPPQRTLVSCHQSICPSQQRVWKMQGKALVKDALVAEAELTAAIADEKENTVLEEA